MFDFSLPDIIARVIVLLIAFTLHELAHAVTADYLGDPTPRHMGRITLNPLAHLDPFGTILLIVSGFGWAKPVMVNPMNLRGNPRTSMAIVAVAGPISNIFLASLAAIPVRLGFIELTNTSLGVFPSPGLLFFEFIWINLILAFFNMIPIPPLDGSKILVALLPPDLAYRFRTLEQYGFLILMLVVMVLPSMLGIDILGPLIGTPSMALFQLLIGG